MIFLIFGSGLILGIFGIYNLLLSNTNQELIGPLVSTGITLMGIGLAYCGTRLAIEADKASYTD
jgi:hypothetical protein